MIIRLLEEKDFKAFKEIDEEATQEYFEYLEREHPEKHRSAIRNLPEIKPHYFDYYVKTGSSFVAEDNGQVVGYVISQTIPCMHGADKVIYIEYIVVRSSHRRRGIGTALLRKVIEYSKQKGIDRIYVDISSDNVPSIQLHLKAGFTVRDNKSARINLK